MASGHNKCHTGNQSLYADVEAVVRAETDARIDADIDTMKSIPEYYVPVDTSTDTAQ